MELDFDPSLIEGSLDLTKHEGEAVMQEMYRRIFEAKPELRTLFADNLDQQCCRVFQTLSLAVSSLRSFHSITPPLRALGAFHASKGVTAEQYPLVVDALCTALARTHGKDWTREHEAAWCSLLDLVARTMIEGVQTSASVPRKRPRAA